MTKADMQKVANAMNLPVHRLANGQCVTNLAGQDAVLTVYPETKASLAGSHGLGDNQPHEYATPQGAGGKL